MEWAGGQFLRRIGLSSRGGSTPTPARPITLTGSAADEKSGLVVSLHSTAQFDKSGNPREVGIRYWRHLPFGQSLDQDLVRLTFKPVKKGKSAELDEVWVQSRLVFSAARGDDPEAPEMKKNIQRVLEIVNRVNALLREGGAVENTARIFDECHVREVAGEDVVIRGLAKEGGFAHNYLRPEFMRAAGAAPQPMEFRAADINALKTALGFRINTLEPDKDFSGSRDVQTADPQSGVLFNAGVSVKETAESFEMTISAVPEDPSSAAPSLSIPNLAKVLFEKTKNGVYALKNAIFMDQKVDPADTKAVLGLLGFIQKSNSDFSQWKFPSFKNHAMRHDMWDKISSLPAPRPLKEGGEMNYLSLHGCGSEKKIENFGDQIGIAAVFLQRGTKEDGTVSTVGVAVDFPFATGGADSNYDGAVPNYLPFLEKISHICITHKHFDHKGGLPYYAAKGLLKDKIIVCTDRVQDAIEKDLNNMQVPRHLRPKFTIVKDDGAMPIHDEDGNIRMWVQYSPNATRHSTLTTPYIVTGCYNDEHYNGAAIVYGDSSGQTERAKNFYKDTTGNLVRHAAEQGYTVSPEKIPFKPFVFHDTTAVRYDGRAPLKSEFVDNLTKLNSLFPERGLVIVPISTNDAEYQGVLEFSHRTKRDGTAVGSNAEYAIRSMNIFGVDPEKDLKNIRIDPFDEWQKPENERLIPDRILRPYMESLSYAHELCGKGGKLCDVGEIKRIHKKEFALRMKEAKKRPEHIKNVETYMLKRLNRDGAITFDNNVNGHLMLRAIMDHHEKSSIFAGRRSQIGRDMRSDPQTHLILGTGTQGNVEENASTVQKAINLVSLLDTDETVRNTGYKIDSDKYDFIITQSAIPGNEASQDRVVRDLAEARNISVIVAYLNGFRIHNPGKNRDHMLSQIRRFGWKHKLDQDGSITVSDCPIHINGHGFKLDLLDMARTIPAELHIPHHIPDYDSHEIFMQLMDEHSLPRPKEKSDDFKLYEINGHAADKDEKFRCIGHIDPSYILVRTLRRFGFAYGGTHEWEEATLLRREGNNRTDALMARSDGDDVHRKKTARTDFETTSNPSKWNKEREGKIGPSKVDRHEGYRRPRSRPMWSIPAQESAP